MIRADPVAMPDSRGLGLVEGAVAVAATVLLPLAGAAVAGRELAGISVFPPPLRIPESYPHWSWFAASAVVAGLGAITLAWIRTARAPSARTMKASRSDDRPEGRWPRWGWAGLAWTGGWSIVAWTRLDGFASVQRFTFFPLWLGFVVSVNAVSQRRTGTCLLIRAPRRLAILFVASAAFWWVFEWLNRFVHNWHYLGVADFGPAAYALHATLCFSTVLPAVASTAELLGSCPPLIGRCADGPRWPLLDHRATGIVLIAAALGGLVFTGAWPEVFYPALWSAPLALGWGLGICMHRVGLWSEIARGDWRQAACWSLAALVCGGFWEMWNVFSAAKWIYTVPYVDRWHVFEMPLLGYAGYLGFGLECALVAGFVLDRERAG